MTQRKQTNVRVADGTNKKISEIIPLRIGRGYLLESYPTLYRQTIDGLRKKFSGAELIDIISVAGNAYLSPDMAGRHLPAQLADAGHIDLSKKTSSLTPFETHCIELWAANSPDGEITGYVAGFSA